MTERALIFTILTAVTIGGQALHCALLKHELLTTPPCFMPAYMCQKCDDHISGNTAEGDYVNYVFPSDYCTAHSAWYLRHRDTHPDIELHYSIEYIPRSRKKPYRTGAYVNNIPLSDAIILMQNDTFPLPSDNDK